MTKNIIKYTLIAVLAALSIALNYLKIPITTNVIVTVYALPLLFAGCCFDFLGSLLVGLITGVVLQLISPYGITVTSPFWALAPIGWTLSSFFINKLFFPGAAACQRLPPVSSGPGALQNVAETKSINGDRLFGPIPFFFN